MPLTERNTELLFEAIENGDLEQFKNLWPGGSRQALPRGATLAEQHERIRGYTGLRTSPFGGGHAEWSWDHPRTAHALSLVSSMLGHATLEELESCRYNEYSLMTYAAARGQLSIMAFMQHRRLDLEAPDSSGETVVHAAARGGHIDLLRSLVDASVDLNAPNPNGDGAAHILARRGRTDALKTLRSHLNLNAVNHRGETAYWLLAQYRPRLSPPQAASSGPAVPQPALPSGAEPAGGAGARRPSPATMLP